MCKKRQSCVGVSAFHPGARCSWVGQIQPCRTGVSFKHSDLNLTLPWLTGEVAGHVNAEDITGPTRG